MDEPTYRSVNEAYEMLAGVRDAGGTVSEKDLAYVVGLLHGTLGPYTQPKLPIERKRKFSWRSLLP